MTGRESARTIRSLAWALVAVCAIVVGGAAGATCGAASVARETVRGRR
jgi:hypothetical protein